MFFFFIFLNYVFIFLSTIFCCGIFIKKSGADNTGFFKTIFDPTYNAYLDSSIGEKPIKGIIRISGRTEGSLGSIKLPGQSFTLKFECEMQGFSWKVVSSKREN